MTHAQTPVRRFVARSSREAMAQVRNAFGEDAVILANRSVTGGVEILAIAPADMDAIAQTATHAAPAAAPMTAPAQAPRGNVPRLAQAAASIASAARNAITPNAVVQNKNTRASRLHEDDEADFAASGRAAPKNSVASDADKLEMSTLAFQDYVRRRMEERQAQDEETPVESQGMRASLDQPKRTQATIHPPSASLPAKTSARLIANTQTAASAAAQPKPMAAPKPAPAVGRQAAAAPVARAAIDTPVLAPVKSSDAQVLAELQAMKGLIEDQLGTMAWLDQVRRDPAQARALRKMLSAGFSPNLSRSITARLPAGLNEADAEHWMLEVLVRNLRVDDATNGIVERGGVYALVGPTGVGKTTTTAKLAATAALAYGPSQVGLVTLDSYRLGAHDQLRAYGKILGIAVHIVHDAQALADLLQLLGSKKLVLIDTVGMSQRDARVREQRALLDIPGVEPVIVLNAAAQSEAIEDAVRVWRPERAPNAAAPVRAIVTKLDEAVTTGGVLDVAVRHELMLSGIGNGQRVPEDWHNPNARMLVHQALRRANAPSNGFAYGDEEISLAFAVRREAQRRQGQDTEAGHA